MLGHLNHAAAIIPLAQHFMNRLRWQANPKLNQNQQISLNNEEFVDLELWIKFLIKAAQGISLNKIVHVAPTVYAISDSCPQDVGGFRGDRRAWCIKIPKSSIMFGLNAINNFLELLGVVINIWLICQEVTTPACILVLSDSSSAVGWLFKLNLVPQSSICFHAIQEATRKMALLLMESGHSLAAEHLPGHQKFTTDALSYERPHQGTTNPLTGNCPDDETLTCRLHLYAPS